MNDGRSGRGQQIWERLRRAIFDAVHAVLGPPPPDVMRKVEDVLREAKRDWEEESKCRDEADETL